jgi:hypothetical protein
MVALLVGEAALVTVRGADQPDGMTGQGRKRQDPSGAECFVVGVGEDREQATRFSG